MYHEIQKLNRLGFSQSRIANFLVMDPRTVNKYLNMTEKEYEQHLIKIERKKILDPYEDFIVSNLSEFPDASSAQIHDWLKEHHEELPEVSPRTVYNFVMLTRQKHNIPYAPITRDFFPIEDLPYGKQAQVDFGEFNMRLSNGKRKKVYFFAMVLSRSRMKFTCFIDSPFTAQEVINAHEKTFEFFGGIPKVIVYDLDRTMVVDENLGEIILTSRFREYTRTRDFELHFCRKADPQSKGKVENVIQYIKKNFLYNRYYQDNEILNQQSIAWLDRTANHLPHNCTKIPPKEDFLNEKKFLLPYIPLTQNNAAEMKKYTVRKNNVIAYKSNFYTLPQGTFTGVESFVLVKEEQGQLLIHDQHEKLICSHCISTQKGKTIRNSNHKRDTSKPVKEMAEKVTEIFSNQDIACGYTEKIRQQWPRYARDHFQILLKALSLADKETADKTLKFCNENSILNARDFERVLQVFINEKPQNTKLDKEIKPMKSNGISNVDHTPNTSNIDDYENYINQ